ncbi:MAG: hypothetical protein HY694_02350 [Deltaproteobacteria bacterium]|nr:hypothetical protein [Deltaproteobacteria bacterium]
MTNEQDDKLNKLLGRQGSIAERTRMAKDLDDDRLQTGAPYSPQAKEELERRRHERLVASREPVIMPPDAEIQRLDDQLNLLSSRFVESSEGLILRADDEGTFKQVILEATTLFDGVLGANNLFSREVNRAVAQGSGGFFGGPSYKCLREVQGIFRAGKRELERQGAIVAHTAPAKKADSYVSAHRIEELRSLKAERYDVTRLIRLCEELNAAYDADLYISIGMLVRAIVDHVPPIFDAKNFSEVANNYAGAKSFKSAMQHLDNSLRNAADALLHVQIRRKEVLPSFQQVDFRADLGFLLAEIVRVLK